MAIVGTIVGNEQVIAASSNLYILSHSLEKRSWALIFGGIMCLSVLMPSFRNMRLFAMLAIVSTVYTALCAPPVTCPIHVLLLQLPIMMMVLLCSCLCWCPQQGVIVTASARAGLLCQLILLHCPTSLRGTSAVECKTAAQTTGRFAPASRGTTQAV